MTSLTKLCIAAGLMVSGAAVIVSCGVSDGYAIMGVRNTYKFLLVSNYGGNTISAYHLRADGSLVQSATTLSIAGASNPSSLAMSADMGRLYATMFNSDAVAAFTVDGMSAAYPSTITPLSEGNLFSVGSGPASMTLSPNGNFAYVVSNDLAANNVHVLSVDPASGTLASLSTASADLNPTSAALSPSGSHLYVTNGGSANLSVFSVDAATGALTEIGSSPYNVQSTPRYVRLDPTGQVLLVVNTGSNSVSTFTVDASTGALSLVGHTAVGTAPERLTIHPSGSFVYVTNKDSDSISAFSLDASAGTLTAVTGSPFTFPGEAAPFAVTVEPDGAYLIASWGTSGSITIFSIDAATGALTPVGDAVPTGSSPRFIQAFQFVVDE